MNNKTELRLLLAKDAAVYSALRLRALKEEPGAFGGSYEESKSLSLEEVRDRIVESENAFVVGAFQKDSQSMVGMAGFFRRRGLKLRHKGEIWGMYTAPEVRGQGLGRALLNEVIERAFAMPGLEEILITVVVGNKEASKLYESVGFVQYGIEARALMLKEGNREEYYDESLMSLRLR
ncbi:GNAT family N-acetyltransferase [bacterium]|nr:GNAT family N-acetyltransferase [bacterium]